MNNIRHIYRSILLSAALLLSLGAEMKAVTYSKTFSSGTHTIEILSAGDGDRFLVKQDGTQLENTYDDLGAITISGGTTTFTINTPNIIWMSNKFSISGSGRLDIVQDPSITGNSVFKRKVGNTAELVNVNGANSTLNITGNGDESRIVFNGNGKFVMPCGEPTKTHVRTGIKCYDIPSLTGGEDGNVKSTKAIIVAPNGTVSMKYSNLVYNYNNNGSDYSHSAGAIDIYSSYRVNITLDYCDIVGCMGYWNGAALFYQNNYNGTPGSSVSFNNCVLRDCFCFGNINYHESVTGGIIRAWGNSGCALSLNNCEIYNNLDNAAFNLITFCGNLSKVPSELISCDIHDNICLYSSIMAVTCKSTIEKCSIYSNKSQIASLFIYSFRSNDLGNAFEGYDLIVDMDENTKIFDNETETNAALSVVFQGESGNGSTIQRKIDGTPISLILNIKGAQIYDNKSKSGAAGISISKSATTPEGYIVEANILSGDVHHNTSQTGNGGGFMISGTLPVTIGQLGKNLSIYGNESQNGGGFYVSNGADVTIYDCKIGRETEPNKAKNGNGGALYVKGGNVEINGGTFLYNQANGNGTNGNGGAFYVENGNVILNGGDIAHNNAQHSGAGLYIKGGDFTVNGGEIQNNTATRNGGGAYVSGGAVTFNGNIQNNNAANGAGLYLAGGADMTYTGGIMTANNARVSGQAISNTAYYGRTGTLPVEGCGGGIYLENGPNESKKTSLKFEFPEGQQTFGLYGNTADKAGQEILAEGHFTDITLPAIANMKLAGFEGQDANPNWYQDYFTDDSEYGDNVEGYTGDHHAVTGKVNHIDRYKTIMSRYGGEFVQHLIPDETLGDIKNKYLAITLGFSMLDLTVTANGLLGGETALVKLIRYGSSGQKVYNVMLKKGLNETSASKTLVNMPWGTYSVIPNNSWNWHYEPIAPMTNIRIGDAAQHEIILDYHHNSVAEQPLHYDVHN